MVRLERSYVAIVVLGGLQNGIWAGWALLAGLSSTSVDERGGSKSVQKNTW